MSLPRALVGLRCSWFGWLCAALAAGGGVPALASEPTPPRPIFRYVTELTADSFVELVEDVANSTTHAKAAPYLPLVMFHVTWCNHCKLALPELEEAAKMVEEARESKQLTNVQIAPKFFVIECDSNAATEKLCAHHVGTTFPSLVLFRDQRAFLFNRPRRSHVFAWWAGHISRPAVQLIETADHWNLLDQAPAFILKTEFGTDKDEMLEAWGHAAFGMLENYNFYVTHPKSAAGKLIQGTAPIAIVRGEGLQPFPLTSFAKDEITTWANFNRFPAVVDVSDWTVSDLIQSKLPVVAYVHSGEKDSVFGLAAFSDVAQELRKSSGKFLFATMNMSYPDTARYVERVFKLVSHHPRIFIFKKDEYWEDPSFTDPQMITNERLEALLNDEQAHHDGTFRSGLRERGKILNRLASESLLGAAIVIVIPSLLLSCCWLCCRELIRGDEPQDDAAVIKKED